MNLRSADAATDLRGMSSQAAEGLFVALPTSTFLSSRIAFRAIVSIYENRKWQDLDIFTGKSIPNAFLMLEKLRGKDVLTAAAPAMTSEKVLGRERPRINACHHLEVGL